MSRVVRTPRSAIRRPVLVTVAVAIVLAVAYLVAAAVVPFAPTTAARASRV